ncbi:MAG: deoxyribose-phosphate aldolase [Erysipelotrichaceae bacterium]|nr:deoxyribose-phosphate aldolase [Erysipelotrichaceae bacterium]
MNEKELAYYFDHTYLKAYATDKELYHLCDEAMELGCHMVAINSSPVKMCREYLGNSPVHVGAAIGFPLGQTTIETKLFETEDALKNGADEIDYVINIGEAKMHHYDYIEKEMKEMVDLVHRYNKEIKVIFENCYLEDEEKIELCHIAKRVKPDFIKTSTGFGTGGATVEDVRLMKKEVGDEVGVKAAGGIRDLDTCLKMIEAGATRIGTSSSVKIINELKERNM